MSRAILVLENIEVRFGAETVLKNINLQIHAQENFVIIGPSGQGKSTLLKVMAGLIVPTQGEVFIEDENLHALNAQRRQQLSRRMGMLFQKNALFDSLTGFENVTFPLVETTDLKWQEISDRAEKILNAVGLSHAKNLYPDEISGGMQKRLGIARALALQPEIVFFDDPTAGLDPITSRKIIELIVLLQKELSSTTISITNDMNRAYQMADRIAVVLAGELVVTGTPEQTKKFPDPRVQQFICGALEGPLTNEVAR